MDLFEGWRIPLYLLPIFLAMWWIRRREAREGNTRFEDLTPGQKAWVLMAALPPGLSARVMASLPPEAVQGYVEEGRFLEGSGQGLLQGVLREFVAVLPREWAQGCGRGLEEMLALVSRCAALQAPEVAAILATLWPAPAPRPAPPAALEAAPLAEEPPEGPPEAGGEEEQA